MSAPTLGQAPRPRRRCRRLAATALVLLLGWALAPLPAAVAGTAVSGTAVPSAAAAARLPAVGAQVHALWADTDEATVVRTMELLRDAGLTWVRVDVSWTMVQPDGPDRWSDWGLGKVDRVVALAEQHGLRPLLTFWLTPGWANGGAGERVLPRDPRAYGTALAAMARRYGDRVGGWEVWNEPNDEHFLVGADPVRYAALLRAAHTAVRATAPAATVVLGGPSYNDDVWLAAVLAAGGAGHYDVLGAHPYPAPSDAPPDLPDDGTPWVLDHVHALRRLMVAAGDGDKPVWFTEVGWSTHPTAPDARPWERGVSDAVQADRAVALVRHVAATMPWVTHVFWYAAQDRRPDPVQQVDGYGLLRHDLTPKPSLGALRDLLRPGGPVARAEDEHAVPAPGLEGHRRRVRAASAS